MFLINNFTFSCLHLSIEFIQMFKVACHNSAFDFLLLGLNLVLIYLQDSDSVHSSEHAVEEIHEIIQSHSDVSAVKPKPSQDDSVSQNTIDKDKYDVSY